MVSPTRLDDAEHFPRQKRRGQTGSDAPGQTAPELQSSADFVKEYVAPDFIVDDVIQRGYLYSLTGRTGDGKTAVALYAAISLAAGLPFAGRAVEKGRCVYLAAENPDDVRARYIMACEEQNLDPATVDVHWIEKPFDIASSISVLRQKLDAIGGAQCIITDTVAAFFLGEEENSNTQLGGYARDLRKLCSLPGKPAVLALAHPFKAANRKADLVPRGGGAFLAEVDGNLSCMSHDNGETTELHWTGKLRGPGFEAMVFRMDKRTSDAVRDHKGRLITSVVATPMSDDEMKLAQAVQLSDEDRLLDAMVNLPSGSVADWCRQLDWIGNTGEPQKSRLHGHLKNLERHKLAAKGRAGRWEPTKLGKKVVIENGHGP